MKRYLRLQKLKEMVDSGGDVPEEISGADIGCGDSDVDIAEVIRNDGDFEIESINYLEGAGFMGAARRLQRSSQRYWLLEYVNRLKAEEPSKMYDVLVLGCTNPSKKQYAIYVYELGLEWKYVSPVGLKAGDMFKVSVASVLPRNGQMTFVRNA